MANKVLAVLLAFMILFSGIVTAARPVYAFGDSDGDVDFGFDSDIDSDSDDSLLGFFVEIFVYIFIDIFIELFHESPVLAIILLIIELGILFLLYKLIRFLKRKFGKKQNHISSHKTSPKVRPQTGGTPAAISGLQPVGAYLKLDPAFSESAFREKISNLFVQYKNALQDKDLSPLQPYFSDALYSQTDRQLETYKKYGRSIISERIAVLSADIVGWKQENGYDNMIVRLKTRFVSYTVDDKTGQLLYGSKTEEIFADYEWQMLRSAGKTTVSASGITVQNCPNCGATININRTAKCAYCDSLITVDAFGWTVNSIKKIS